MSVSIARARERKSRDLFGWRLLGFRMDTVDWRDVEFGVVSKPR